MSREIRWSGRAVESLSTHLSYLQENWGQDVVVNFLDRIEEVVATISKYPKLYPSFDLKEEKIFRAVISKHLVLYYRLENETIELITFWGTRQDPESLDI